MSSRDRDTKSLQDKLKVFFKKGASAPLPARSELVVGAELERELGADSPMARRLRALRDLADKVMVARVKEGGVEKLWSSIRDLLEDSNEEARHTALWFLQRIAEGQADYLQIMRTILFRYLRNTNGSYPSEDYQLRFKLLHTLTNSGKNINCFEEEVGPFLLECLPQIEAPSNLVEFLQLIINVVKYNATYLDEHIVHGIVTWACQLGVHSAEAAVVTTALSLLEAVVSYSLLPRAALRCFVSALCRTVNLENYCHHSWKLMRNVVGADIGHAALHEMVQLVRDGEDAGLVRGAVFYINMALWGPRRVPTLNVSYLAVLPAFLKALERRQAVVTYEVVVSVQSVVSKASLELEEPAWDVLLLILAEVLHQDKSYDPPNELIHTQVHAVITAIEQLHDAGQYSGDAEALLDLIDLCGHERPESSTLRLVSWRGAALSAAGGAGLGAALALAERYVRREPRLAVRTHALRQILDFVQRHRFLYGEELVELVCVPVLGGCVQDKEPALRAAAARALVELALACTSDACTDLVDLLEKILNRAFEAQATDATLPADADVSDILAAAAGLLEILHAKLLGSPGAHAARAFLVLLDHLDLHYRRARLLHHHPQIRLKVLEMLFGLRANQLNCVGFCYDSNGGVLSGGAAVRVRPTCSPFLLAEPAVQRAQPPPPPRDLQPGACLVPVGRAARLLVTALTTEKDWAVLAHVLRTLPGLLQARALVLGRRAQDLDMLASTLCSMISDRSVNFPECLRVAGGHKPLVSEFHGAVLPALAQLAPYHAFLEPQTQQRIVRCLLKYGMVLRTPQPYITALTIFTLEMRETMVKMLPEVLLDLSKISDTKAIARPMLEFLSTLTRLPKVFASFVEDQYMSVFAILLPYTNPSRYEHYVVSLAHHVIAAWFLKCRLSYRRNFVRFIIHGLHNYIIMPFEEQHKSTHFQNAATNEDSSNRQRSSSLGSKVSRSAGALGGRGASAGTLGSASAAFHVELTETCLDLLARYTTTPCSVKPHRSDTAEFLLNGGQSMTWLVGHKLITITTSGCLQNSLKQGLCDRCCALCRQHAARVASPLPPGGAAEVVAMYAGGEAPWRVGALAGAGACPCVCAAWAEVHVRSPTGDVSWLMRLQNQMNWDYMLESPLQDVAALLSALEDASAAAPEAPPSSASSDIGDSRQDVEEPVCAQGSELEERSRSGTAPAAHPLHKSSSDSVVGEGGPHARAHRVSTQPINIPGSPQRQSSSSTADDEDMLLIVPESKSRHPVRRSNSSPEMSSSWKTNAQRDTPPALCEPHDMIVLASCEPTTVAGVHVPKKPTKKSEMRVSCEAIPEEMSGTSPHAPHLATHKSDPGEDPARTSRGSATSHHQLQKTASEGAVVDTRSTKPPAAPRGPSVGGASASGGGASGTDREELPPLARSKRSNTISVMSPTRRHRAGAASGAGPGAGAVGAGGGGVSPSFVFLQLYHNMSTYPITPPVPGEAPAILNPLAERPLRVCGVQNERTIKNLDLVPPIETYKIGVLYVGPGQQDDEVSILKNEYGSLRYAEFLRQLGTLVSLAGDAEEQPHLFLNLEKGGKDGMYTYVWNDDIMQVLFHVATAMPYSDKDPSCNEKRKYIGNDYVSIVYNESGADFNIHTIKGQLNFHIVLVEPYESGMSRVLVKSKEGRGGAWSGTAHCVSDQNAALLARQTALHCALAAHIAQSLQLCAGAPYASNSLERLRLIKRVRARAQAERLALAARAPAPYAAAPELAHRVAMDDFNDYA